MAQQHINLGTANGQNGDFVRVAFNKSEDNFTELYNMQDLSDRILSGGITNSANNLTFSVVINSYIKNQQLYPVNNSVVTDTITLSAADPTNPRIDVIVVTTDETIEVREGTPAANPAEPIINYDTDLKITSVLINAGATSPSNFSTELVYDENVGEPTEWDATESTSGTNIDLASSADAYSNSLSIETTNWDAKDYFEFTKSSTINVNDLSSLSFRINKKAASTTFQLDVMLLNGSTPVRKLILNGFYYGFSLATLVGTYQHISVSLSEFETLSSLTEFDTIRFILVSGDNTDIFVDNVLLSYSDDINISPQGNYIPLAGTEVGKPVTGTIEFDLSAVPLLYQASPTESYSFNFVNFDHSDTSSGFSNGLDISDFTNVVLYSSNPASKGLLGAQYWGANYTDNTFVQKKYVDDQISGIDTESLLSLTSTIVTSTNALVSHIGGMNEVDSASDVTITVQDNSTVDIPVGNVLSYIQEGDGKILVDLTTTGESTQTYKKGDVVTLWHKSLDVWVVLNHPHALDSKTDGEPTGSDQVLNIVSLTQAEYDAGTPVADTFYVITDA